jgi:putative colanic acid biosynthesis acetyltransferase WcaF
MHPRTTFGHQQQAIESPWSSRTRIAILLWHFAWPLLCGWTPKPLNRWRLLILRMFGARIHGHPFVHQNARIQMPWNLILHPGASLGDGAVAYSLGEIEIGRDATVAQEAYLCTGTHAFDQPAMNLVVGKISVGAGAFVGARAFVMPGVEIGAGAIVGSCAVVTRDVPDAMIVAGNPARIVKPRPTAA